MVQKTKKTVNVESLTLDKLSEYAKTNDCKIYEILEELIHLIDDPYVSERIKANLALRKELEERIRQMRVEEIAALLSNSPTQ